MTATVQIYGLQPTPARHAYARPCISRAGAGRGAGRAPVTASDRTQDSKFSVPPADRTRGFVSPRGVHDAPEALGLVSGPRSAGGRDLFTTKGQSYARRVRLLRPQTRRWFPLFSRKDLVPLVLGRPKASRGDAAPRARASADCGLAEAAGALGASEAANASPRASAATAWGLPCVATTPSFPRTTARASTEVGVLPSPRMRVQRAACGLSEVMNHG